MMMHKMHIHSYILLHSSISLRRSKFKMHFQKDEREESNECKAKYIYWDSKLLIFPLQLWYIRILPGKTGAKIECMVYSVCWLGPVLILRLRPVLQLQRGAKLARFPYWIYNNIHFIKWQKIIQHGMCRSNQQVFLISAWKACC